MWLPNRRCVLGFLVIVVTIQAAFFFCKYGLPKTSDAEAQEARYVNLTDYNTHHEYTKPSEYPEDRPGPERANAVILILSRNSDTKGLNQSISQLEHRFNSNFHYPYVFLNDEPHSEDFIREVSRLSKSKMTFGRIPHGHWSYPPWINLTRADEGRAELKSLGAPYADSIPYRHMCRFNSGFFFQHPLLKEYEFYWRVEPSVEFLCTIDYDPFIYMRNNNIKYGFTIAMGEFEATIKTLWDTTQKFIKENKKLVHKKNFLDFLTRPHGDYNTCHFWSNFEIASLEFFRSKAYRAYFDYLDRAGGFFYERWGDAPVHTLAAAMLLPIEQVHYFEDIGYSHEKVYNCPSNPALNMRCNCDPMGGINTIHPCHQFWKLTEIQRVLP